MTEEVYLERFKPDPDGLDFESLKKEGISLLQELSGKAWTDYNLHDPGVTILEVLCYALTDLAYRTDFDTGDFLSGANGQIDFTKQALFRPHDIFPSQAITPDDYRKILFDAIPSIDNVWITRVEPDASDDADRSVRGLYAIFVMLAENHTGDKARKEDEQQIEADIRREYAAKRNLCEDLKDVKMVKPVDHILQGTVEIGGQRNPAEILAEIYFRSANYICPGLGIRPFAEMLHQGRSLEEIFSGPRTEHGYISFEDLRLKRRYAQVSDLIGIIGEVEGVKYVDQLWFDKGDKVIEYDPTLATMPRLQIPDNHIDIPLKLEKNGRRYHVTMKSVRVELDRLRFEDRALRFTRQDFAGVSDLPHGQYRNFAEYFSIQNHFPEIYGIGRYGVPRQPGSMIEEKAQRAGGSYQGAAIPTAEHRRESIRQNARARQLKAYLLIFEQIMANFLANLEELPRLFSLDEDMTQTYFTRLLDNDVIPAVAEIYTDSSDRIDPKIAQQLAEYDKFNHRRNRILDYLLGIYGEKFTQHSLRRFNYYHTEQELKRELILNKITFLKQIVDLSRNRAAGFNYLKSSWEVENNEKMGDVENISRLEKKVNLLLGLRSFKKHALAKDAKPLECEGCHIIEHILLRPLSGESHTIRLPDDFYSFKISVIFPAWTPRFKDREFQKLAEETIGLCCPAHVLPEFYWLDRPKMELFEDLYSDWLKLKCEDKECGGKASDEDIDQTSQKLIKFLLEHQEPSSESKESTN